MSNVIHLDDRRPRHHRQHAQQALDLDEQLSLAAHLLRGIKTEADEVLWLESPELIRKLGQVYATVRHVIEDRAERREVR